MDRSNWIRDAFIDLLEYVIRINCRSENEGGFCFVWLYRIFVLFGYIGFLYKVMLRNSLFIIIFMDIEFICI